MIDLIVTAKTPDGRHVKGYVHETYTRFVRLAIPQVNSDGRWYVTTGGYLQVHVSMFPLNETSVHAGVTIQDLQTELGLCLTRNGRNDDSTVKADRVLFAALISALDTDPGQG